MMKLIKLKYKYTIIIGAILSAIAIALFARSIQADAANDYYFVFNNQSLSIGNQAQLNTQTAYMSIVSPSGSTAQVKQWISSDDKIVSVHDTSYDNKSFVQLRRESPGYATITAVFDDGFMAYCVIRVDLAFDYAKMSGIIYSTTNDERIMTFDTIGQERTAYIKYVVADGSTGDDSIDNSLVDWSSSNVGVVTVDSGGKLKAVGAGSADITVSTKTLYGDKPMSAKMRVVVAPNFTVSLPDSSGQIVDYNSSDDINVPQIVDNVPSEFTVKSNSTLGNNLKWVIYDTTGGTKKVIPAGSSTKMTYSISQTNGNVNFSNVKAGTYEIFAFANSSYNENTNAPYAYMKIVVPIRIPNKDLVMVVGNTYSLLDNSNLPGTGIFTAPVYLSGNSNIASFNATNYVFTAKTKGKVQIQLNYNAANKLYDSSTMVDPFVINITVIDKLALNNSSADLEIGQTLQLEPLVSDPLTQVIWTSTNPNIASVEEGMVKAISTGDVTITAQQTIGGVVMTATCEISVKKSVTKVELACYKTILDIGELQTITATITPKDARFKLNWRSSNPSVVKINTVANPATTATIQAVAGGRATITATNEYNVEMGSIEITVRQPVQKITLSKTEVSINLTAKNYQLSATVAPDNVMDKTILWQSADTTKATVDDNGFVTLLKPGTVSIIATSKDNPKVTAICNLTILIPTQSLELLEKNKTMFTGNTDQLKYNLLPDNASNRNVTWTSTNTAVVTVDGAGKVTAKAVGTSVIILKTVDGGLTAYCTIDVKQSATGIKLDKTVIDLLAGKFEFLKATLTPADTTDNKIEWSSYDTNIAKVDDYGKVTAISSGSTLISAKINGYLAICKINVTQPVTGISLDSKTKTIYKGQKFKLTPTIEPKTATNKSVTWKSSNNSVVAVAADGTVTGVAGGAAAITCTTVDGQMIDICVVTVKELVSSIKINPTSYKLGLNKTVILTAIVSTQTASNKNVTWKSNNTKVATVDSKGKVTGKKLGYATITAIAKDGSQVEASCEIRVVTLVTSISLNKYSSSMYVGTRQKLTATIKPSNATYKTAKWTSSNTKVATVDSTGTVTALSKGTALITASALDSSGRKAICYLSVNERIPATGITMQDTEVTMVQGEKKSVLFVLTPSNSSDGVKWSSNNAGVASVDKTKGIITAKATGVAVISVMTDSGKKATIMLTVVGLSDTKLTTEVYTTYKQALSVEGAKSKVKWSSQNQKIVEIYSDGTISTRGPGTTTVTATINGRKLKCKITVKKMTIKKKTVKKKK